MSPRTMYKRRTPLTRSSKPARNWFPKAEVYVLITTPPPGRRVAQACAGAKARSSVLETRSKRQVTSDDMTERPRKRAASPLPVSTAERPQKRSKLSANASTLPREKSGFPVGITPLTALRMETRGKALERPEAISKGGSESKETETTANVDSGTKPNQLQTPLAANANGGSRPSISPGSSALKVKLRFLPRTPSATDLSTPSTSPKAGNQGPASTSPRVRLIVRPPVSSASSESTESKKREDSVTSGGLSEEELSTPDNLPVGLPDVAVSTREVAEYAPGLGKSIGVLRPAFDFASYAETSSDDDSDFESGIRGDNGMEARERERQKYASCTTWLASALSDRCKKCAGADMAMENGVTAASSVSLPLAVPTGSATMNDALYQSSPAPPSYSFSSPSPASPIPDPDELIYPCWESSGPDTSAAEAYVRELHTHGLYVPFPDGCDGPQYERDAVDDAIRGVATSLLAVGPGQ